MITKMNGEYGEEYFYNTEAMQNVVIARSLLTWAAQLLRRAGRITKAELDRRMKSLEDGHGETADGAKVAEVLATLLAELRVDHRSAQSVGADLNELFAPMVRNWIDAETDPAAVNYIHQFLFAWDLKKPGNTEKDVKEDVEESVP